MSMIPITGLWERDGRNGLFMTGKLGQATLFVFPNNRKNSDRDPDYQVFLAESKGQGNRGQYNQGRNQSYNNQSNQRRYQPGETGTYQGPIDKVDFKSGSTSRGQWVRYTLHAGDDKFAIFGDPNGQAGDWGEQARSYSGSGKHLEMAWLADEYGRKVTSFRILQTCDNWGPGPHDPPSQPDQPTQTELGQGQPGQDQPSYGQPDCGQPETRPWDGQPNDDLPF